MGCQRTADGALPGIRVAAGHGHGLIRPVAGKYSFGSPGAWMRPMMVSRCRAEWLANCETVAEKA